MSVVIEHEAREPMVVLPMGPATSETPRPVYRCVGHPARATTDGGTP
jgi:hypothetical protein